VPLPEIDISAARSWTRFLYSSTVINDDAYGMITAHAQDAHRSHGTACQTTSPCRRTRSALQPCAHALCAPATSPARLTLALGSRSARTLGSHTRLAHSARLARGSVRLALLRPHTPARHAAVTAACTPFSSRSACTRSARGRLVVSTLVGLHAVVTVRERNCARQANRRIKRLQLQIGMRGEGSGAWLFGQG